MFKSRIFPSLVLLIFSVLIAHGSSKPVPGKSVASPSTPDSLQRNQVMYNGRVWRNLYSRVVGNQFLFSGEFLNGTITMADSRFTDVPLLYDIYNDELLSIGSAKTILELNKEMVDSFSLNYQSRDYRFAKIEEDSTKGSYGYVNILYSGKTTLYIKYRKQIALLDVDEKYDRFFETSKIYYIKDGIKHLIRLKHDLLKVMSDHKSEVKNFIRKNNAGIYRKNPDSYVPVVRYYDSLIK